MTHFAQEREVGDGVLSILPEKSVDDSWQGTDCKVMPQQLQPASRWTPVPLAGSGNSHPVLK